MEWYLKAVKLNQAMQGQLDILGATITQVEMENAFGKLAVGKATSQILYFLSFARLSHVC